MGLVQVTAHMGAPIVLTEEWHLDGLLMSAHPRCRRAPISRTTPVDQLVRAPIPIARATARGHSVWLSTAAHMASDARTSSEYTVKRRDGEDLSLLSERLHLGLGPGKNKMHRLPVVITATVRWLAVGSPREILRLARRITHLGGWRSAGYGSVIRWEALYVTRAADVVLIDGGIAQRNLPVEWTEWTEERTTGSLEPPYWHPARQTVPIVPAGTRCAIPDAVLTLVRALADPAAHRAHTDRHDARKDARRAAG